MKRNVLIGDIDEEAYRRTKAAAALRDIPVGRAVSEALASWPRRQRKGNLEEEVKADRAFLWSSWGS